MGGRTRAANGQVMYRDCMVLGACDTSWCSCASVMRMQEMPTVLDPQHPEALSAQQHGILERNICTAGPGLVQDPVPIGCCCVAL